MRRYLLVYIVVVWACHYYSRAEAVKLNAGRLKQVLPIGAKSAALLTAIFSSGTFDSHGSSSCPCADCAGFSPVPVARLCDREAESPSLLPQVKDPPLHPTLEEQRKRRAVAALMWCRRQLRQERRGRDNGICVHMQ